MEKLRKFLAEGQTENAISLVHNGLDPNSYDENGWSVLHYAAYYADIEFVKFLLSQGIAVDKRAHSTAPDVIGGQTPLHALVFGAEGDIAPLKVIECAQYLIERGADIDAEDSDGETPLHCIAKRSKVTRALDELSRFLINAGANINKQDRSGYAPIHTTALYGYNIEFLHLLLQSGASSTAKTANGETPLRIAYRRKNKEIFRILSKQGKGAFWMKMGKFFYGNW